MNVSLETQPRSPRTQSDQWTLTASATVIADGLKMEWDVRGSTGIPPFPRG